MAIALRLFTEDLPKEDEWPRCTLRHVFDRWFIPHVLEDPCERDEPASSGTLTIYRNALAWWEAATGNPEVGQITPDTLRQFLEGLKTITYKRGIQSTPRHLSRASRNKHKKQIRTILRRLTVGAEHPSLPILGNKPKLKLEPVDEMPKPTPEFAHFKSLIDRMTEINFQRRLACPAGVQPVHFWRALLATLYCCGWRLETTLALRWEWLDRQAINEQAEVIRMRLPSDANFKTGKWDLRPIPPWLFNHWKRMRVTFAAGDFPVPVSGLIFGEEFCTRRLQRNWERIQRKLNPKSKVYSFQALRRLHGEAMTAVGFDIASSVAQVSLQHSSAATTRKYYARIVEAATFRLPEV